MTNETVAKLILEEFMKHRRTVSVPEERRGASCPNCRAHHYPKILAAVEQFLPVAFVLPAFPGKSPNPNKVLGALPDLAERLSLEFLGGLCRKVKEFYRPGIKIMLCSDGRVFSDVVGMKEEEVSAYQKELVRLITELELSDLSTFNLEDFYPNMDFKLMRMELMRSFGHSLEQLKERVRSKEEAKRMYCGITRFLFEDANFPGQSRSRAALQRDAKRRAYELIRRSNAWSDLIAERFPEAVRLSIHPQGCGSEKLGIRLVGEDSWMTPWHGVALKTKNGHKLVKRVEAQELGAKLVLGPQGRPCHYTLMEAGQ